MTSVPRAGRGTVERSTRARTPSSSSRRASFASRPVTPARQTTTGTSRAAMVSPSSESTSEEEGLGVEAAYAPRRRGGPCHGRPRSRRPGRRRRSTMTTTMTTRPRRGAASSPTAAGAGSSRARTSPVKASGLERKNRPAQRRARPSTVRRTSGSAAETRASGALAAGQMRARRATRRIPRTPVTSPRQRSRPSSSTGRGGGRLLRLPRRGAVREQHLGAWARLLRVLIVDSSSGSGRRQLRANMARSSRHPGRSAARSGGAERVRSGVDARRRGRTEHAGRQQGRRAPAASGAAQRQVQERAHQVYAEGRKGPPAWAGWRERTPVVSRHSRSLRGGGSLAASSSGRAGERATNLKRADGGCHRGGSTASLRPGDETLHRRSAGIAEPALAHRAGAINIRSLEREHEPFIYRPLDEATSPRRRARARARGTPRRRRTGGRRRRSLLGTKTPPRSNARAPPSPP